MVTYQITSKKGLNQHSSPALHASNKQGASVTAFWSHNSHINGVLVLHILFLGNKGSEPSTVKGGNTGWSKVTHFILLRSFLFPLVKIQWAWIATVILLFLLSQQPLQPPCSFAHNFPLTKLTGVKKKMPNLN